MTTTKAITIAKLIQNGVHTYNITHYLPFGLTVVEFPESKKSLGEFSGNLHNALRLDTYSVVLADYTLGVCSQIRNARIPLPIHNGSIDLFKLVRLVIQWMEMLDTVQSFISHKSKELPCF